MRVAIVGAGLMGTWHAYYARRLGAQIVAVVDPDLARAEALGRRFGAASCPSLSSALEEQALDLVHICSALDSHFDLVRSALSASLHVIVEKPMARDPEQVDVLLELAKKAGRLLIPVHQFAFQPGVERAEHELLKRGTPALSVSFDFASAGGQGRDQSELNRIVAEILPHPFSILQRLWPSSPGKEGPWNVRNAEPGELLAQGTHAEIPVSLRVSMNARPTRCRMDIAHAEGELRIDLFHGFAALDGPMVSRRAKVLAPFSRSLRTMLGAAGNLALRALKRQPAYPGLEQLLRSVYQSVESGAALPMQADDIRAVARRCAHIEEQLGS